jgi:hypothetical protein
MLCRLKSAKPGNFFRVRDSNAYPLPNGLRAGSMVELISFDHGYWSVEHDGKIFSVFLTLIESGFQFEWNGRWLQQDDPRVVKRLAETRLSDSPAYSIATGGCLLPIVEGFCSHPSGSKSA